LVPPILIAYSSIANIAICFIALSLGAFNGRIDKGDCTCMIIMIGIGLDIGNSVVLSILIELASLLVGIVGFIALLIFPIQ